MKKSLLAMAAFTGTLALLGATEAAFAAIDTVTPPDQLSLSDILDQAKAVDGIQGQVATTVQDTTKMTALDREAANQAIVANPTVFNAIAILPSEAQAAIVATPQLVKAASVLVASAQLEPAGQSVISEMLTNTTSAATLTNMSSASMAAVVQTLRDPESAKAVAAIAANPTTATAIASHVNLLQSRDAVKVVSTTPAVAKSETVLTVLEQPKVATVFNSAPIATKTIDALASVTTAQGKAVIAALTETTAKTLVESANPVAVTPPAIAASQSVQATTNQTIARLDALQLEKVLALYRANRGEQDAPQGPAGPTGRKDSRPEPGVWGSFIGSKADQDEINGSKGYEFDSKGVMFGYDRNLSPTILLGLNAGYTDTDTTMDAGVEAGNTVKATSVSLYANQAFNAFLHASYGLTYAGGDIDNRHRVNGDTVTSSTESHTYSLFSQVAYDLLQPKYLLSPLFRVQISRNKTDGYTESGSTLGLNAIVADNTTNLFATAFGVNGVYFLNDNIDLKGRARWSHEWSGDSQPISHSYFSGSSATSFTESTGIELGRDRFNFALGGKFDLGKMTSLDLDYEVELAQAYLSHTGVAKLKYQF